MSKSDVYEAVTAAIIEELEAGRAPWRQPWSHDPSQAMPMNLVSKRTYRGINLLVLGMAAMRFGSPYFLTFKQVGQLGGKVVKGSKSTPVMFWKELMVKDEAAEDGKKKILMARMYHVFNVAQTTGLEEKIPAAVTPADFDPVEEAEKIIAEMPSAPPVKFGGNRAFYHPVDDRVQMPKREQFKSVGAYYNTLFHELSHATGHASRLDREGITSATAAFGSMTYSKEELVAELSACFVGAVAGTTSDIPQSAAYCRSWLKALSDDRKMLVSAASAASKSADFILGSQD